MSTRGVTLQTIGNIRSRRQELQQIVDFSLWLLTLFFRGVLGELKTRKEPQSSILGWGVLNFSFASKLKERGITGVRLINILLLNVL